MSEPDFPYPKRPRPEETAEISPELKYPASQSPPPPPPQLITENTSKFICQICGKTFNTKEELTLHT
ncbi:MAG: C2H2-type zinc finger protein [Candidatus Bathyarchaeia archaeon]